MKKIYLSIVCACSSLLLQAQFKSGDIFLGGSFGIVRNENKNIISTTNRNISYTFNVNPFAEKFLKSNTSWGAGLVYNADVNKYKSATLTTGENNHNSYGGEAFIKIYKAMGKGFNLYAKQSVGLRIGYNKNSSMNASGGMNESKSNYFTAGYDIAPGLGYFISKKIMLNVQLNQMIHAGYSFSKSQDNKQNSFGISTTSSLGSYGVGVIFKL